MYQVLPEWVFGMIMSLIGNICSNLGLNIQKLSHKSQDGKDYQRIGEGDAVPTPYYQQPTWILGFCVFCIGELSSGVAMGYTSQSLLAVLSSCSLIANGFFASFLLNERITSNYIKAAAIIMLGSSIVVCSASHRDQHYRLSDLTHLFRSWSFLVFLIVVVSILAVVICLRQFFFNNPRISAAIASISACFSVLFAKCSVQLLKASFIDADAENQFTDPTAWFILILFFLFAGCNVHFINLALRQGRSVVVFPFYFATSTILVVTCGVVFFREFAMFSPIQLLCFLVGVSVTIYGVQQTTHSPRRRSRRRGAEGIDEDPALVPFPVRVES